MRPFLCLLALSLPAMPLSCAPEVDEPAIHAWLVTEVGFVAPTPVKVEPVAVEPEPVAPVKISLFDRAATEGKKLCLAVDTAIPAERDANTIYAEVAATDFYHAGNVYYLEPRDGQFHVSRVCTPSQGYCRTCR